MRTLVCRPSILAVAIPLVLRASIAMALPEIVSGKPDAIVDLETAEGAQLVGAQWRVSDVSFVEVDHRAPGPDLRPSGPPNRTHDITPKAGARDFDDSRWAAIEPRALLDRRGSGRFSFQWYRTKVKIPPKVGSFATAGSTVVFETVVDDYAEVWVDGRLPIVLGSVGGSFVKGFNAPNRVVLTHDARPGQEIELAVFGMNGPVSDPPGNFIWVRSATLDFYGSAKAKAGRPVDAEVVRHDAALDALVPRDAKFEKLAGGFTFTEGPVWVPDGNYLLFSDPNENVIYRLTPDGDVSIFRAKSGYSGFDIGEFGQPGSNGLALDREGRLTVDEHGRRRVVRIEKTGAVTVLADRWEGKRLNSPNDLVYRSDGALCFSDPPFGLPKFHADPRRELEFTGVFCLLDGELRLVTKELSGPNGLAFSPDEKFLYVTNWDEKKKVVMRYAFAKDGTVGESKVFFDMTDAPGEEALDGLKIDERGNLYVSGPGGVWILSPAGVHLGTLRLPELPANFAWGDDDGRTLYMTARTSIYRVRLNVGGKKS